LVQPEFYNSGFLFLTAYFLLSPSKTPIMKKLYSIFFAVVSLAFGSFSQISDGGQPISFGVSSNKLSQIQPIDLAKPNLPL
jgi:hypothetical protein